MLSDVRFWGQSGHQVRPKEKRGSPFPSGLPLTKSAIPGFVLGRRVRHDGGMWHFVKTANKSPIGESRWGLFLLPESQWFLCLF